MPSARFQPVRAWILAVLWGLLLPAHVWAEGCTQDADCKAGRVCQDGACREATPGCAADRDCPGEQWCESGRCVAPHPAPPPGPQPSVSPRGTPDIPPRGSPPAPVHAPGPALAWEAYLGGGFQDRDGFGSGIGWVGGGGVGVRFESGVGLLAIGGYASGSSTVTYSDGTSSAGPRLHLAHVGGALSLRSPRGSTTLGLAYASTPDTPRNDTGLAFVFRYFYAVSGRVSVVLDSAMAVVGDGRASTFSLGIGYAD